MGGAVLLCVLGLGVFLLLLLSVALLKLRGSDGAVPSFLSERRCISRLRGMLARSPSLLRDHADVAAVLHSWDVVGAPDISRTDPSSRRIFLKLRHTTGQFFDTDTLLLAFTHELAHAALAAGGHGPEFQRKTSACAAALQRDGLLSPGAEPHPLYPAVLLDGDGEAALFPRIRAAHLGDSP